MRAKASVSLTIRKPEAADGGAAWQLVKDTGSLDLNSAYSYIMLCDMFQDTCAIAETDEGKVVGFVSGFRKPDRPDTLFIWQIGVDAGCRGQGIGKRLLRELLGRGENAGIRFVEATVGPNNQASRQLFLRLAAELESSCQVSERYSSRMFPEPTQHDDELMYRVGPFRYREA